MRDMSVKAFVAPALWTRPTLERRQRWRCAQRPPNEGDSAAARKRAADEMVRRDMLQLKQKRAAKEASDKSNADETPPLQRVRGVVETLLLVDFFLVVALLGWLVVALIPHFANSNDVLLDPWLALWKPFIQPVLGVLMLGTIVQGTISYVRKNE